MADEEAVSSLLYALAVTRQFAFKGQKGAPMGGRGAAIPISIAPPAPSEGGGQVRDPAVRSRPELLGARLRGRSRVASVGAPPEPVSFPSEDLRASKETLAPSSLRGRELDGAARGEPKEWPGSLTDRPAPMGIDRTNSEIANAERALEGMTHFRLAESALQRSDLTQAERLAARAVISDPDQTDYVALHAWIRAMSNATDEGTTEAIQTLTRLLVGEGGQLERALLYRGKLFKRMNRAREALRDFERLVQVNPRHREAATEVRLLKQRAAK